MHLIKSYKNLWRIIPSAATKRRNGFARSPFRIAPHKSDDYRRSGYRYYRSTSPRSPLHLAADFLLYKCRPTETNAAAPPKTRRRLRNGDGSLTSFYDGGHRLRLIAFSSAYFPPLLLFADAPRKGAFDGFNVVSMEFFPSNPRNTRSIQRLGINGSLNGRGKRGSIGSRHFLSEGLPP